MMAKTIPLKLVILLFFPVVAVCIFFLLKVHAISAQLSELKKAMPSHVEDAPLIQGSGFYSEKLDDVLLRLARLEKSVEKYTAQPAPLASTQNEKQPSEPQNVPEGQMPEEAFQEGRMQWQQKYAASMFDDAEKKSLVIATFLADNHELDAQKQQQVAKIMRAHFLEFAYAITDTGTYPSFDSFSKQVEHLNRQKMRKLSNVLSEQEITSFNAVDWMQIFKSNGLN